MKQFIKFIFLIFILIRLSRANSSTNLPKIIKEQRFDIEPSDKTAIVGETIILPCRVTNRVGALQWTKDGFGLGLDRALSGFPRYQMIGSEEEGDYSLEITNVQLDDDAYFQCQVGASSNVPGIRSRSSKVTVFIPPQPVHIKEGEFLDTVEGKKVTLNCESNGGKPKAELSWLDENGHSIIEGVDFFKEELSDGKRFNSLATWQFTAGKQHHNKRFTCRAESSALGEPQKTSILIKVRFSPKIKLTYAGDYQMITNEPSAVQEEGSSHDSFISDSMKETEELNENIVAHVGENVTINCDTIAANPNTGLIYKWYKDEQIFAGDHSTNILNIPSISADLNGVKIGCEVINNIGSSGVIYRQLSVSFAPKFSRGLAKSYTVMEGSNLKLACEVRSNPPADITWYFDNAIIGKGKNLQLVNMDYSKAGRYACVVNVKGFNEIQSTTNVQIKGAPRVISSANQFGLEGEPIRLECLVQSIPRAASVVWRRNSQLIDVDNKNGYELITEPLPESDSTIRHLLVIRNAKLIDFGQYNCTATNELGEDSILITLTRQKTFPALMIIASVVGASAALLCIGLVVLILMRKSSNKTGDNFSSSLKKQTAGTNSSMVLTNSNNTNSNYNKALTDSGRSHMTVDNGSSAANSDLNKLEIRTSSSLSDQEHHHHNQAIQWDDELIMNNTLLTANGLYNGQHVQAFTDTQNNSINVYDPTQFNTQQHFIIANNVAPNYESIYNYPAVTANGQLTNSQQITLNMSQPMNNVLNNNCLTTANKYSSPAKQLSPTYHNLTNLTNHNLNLQQQTSNLYLPSYTDYGQLIDCMQIQNNQQTSQQSNDQIDNQTKLLGYTINSNGQPIITNLSKQQCESAYSTLQTDSRYRAQCANTNYGTTTRTPFNTTTTTNQQHAINLNTPGLPSSPLYGNNQLSTTNSNNSNAILVPNNNTSTLRNYITNNQVNSLNSVNNQATLATHV